MTSRRMPGRARVLLGALGGILCLASLLWAVRSPAAGNDSPVAGLSQEETLRLGERIYREGILPSGEPLTAIVQKDIQVEGTMFTCVNCHLRSGLGSFEGGVLTPPTNGNVLYRLWDSRVEAAKLKGGGHGGGNLKRSIMYDASDSGKSSNRPAYTDVTLADAIREGANPVGRSFLGVMPRYPLGERDMAILIAYLKSLSARPSPGVTEATIRFATVISEEVSGAERDEMLVPLERFLRKNTAIALREAVDIRERYAVKVDVSGIPAERDYRQMSLARWELKGSPDSWREQLEDYYRKEPVFALLGGITTKEWRPVHEFCEDHAIPCLFPITDLPLVSPNGWYTLYFSKGFYQEGEAAARHLASTEDPGRSVVQVYPDTPEGNAFASGFRNAWIESGRGPLVDKTFPAGTPAAGEVLERVAGKERRAVLVLWTGPEALPALETAAGKDSGVSTIYMSASLLKGELLAVPETLREKTFITYPYRWLSGTFTVKAERRGMKKKPLPEIVDRKIADKVAALSIVLTEVFAEWQSNFYRDYMLDVIDGSAQRLSSPYELISFGPGQRYASKGCYIVQVSKGDRPKLLKKSDWVIH